MPTFLTVKPEHLAALDAGDATDTFRGLLHAEARRVNLPISQVSASSKITTPDGGVDASVEDSTVISDIFNTGYTAYQIKSGTSFKPQQASAIRGECLDKDGNLKKGIEHCLEQNGKYILVCFGIDLVDRGVAAALENMKQLFAEFDHSNASVGILLPNQLIGVLARYPALCMNLNGNWIGSLMTHREWRRQPKLSQDYRKGEGQESLLKAIRQALSSNEPARMRLLSEPGAGKTRAALEATAVAELEPVTLYAESPRHLVDTGPNEVLRSVASQGMSGVLVVDECDSRTTDQLADILARLNSQIHLLTIYNEQERPDRRIDYLPEVPPLTEEQIGEILRSYGVPEDGVYRWARECEGSPRVAHILGDNLANDPEDVLSGGMADLWDRYLAGTDQLESPEFHRRKTVMMYLALFKRFGYGVPGVAADRLTEEAKAIANIVAKHDPDITWSVFQNVVSELRNRKVLQGDYTFYITPKLLQVRLWLDYWDLHGAGFDYEEFRAGLVGQLNDWFVEMFRYAGASPAAKQVVKRLLDDDGPFGELSDLNRQSFFLALTEASPSAALDRLETLLTEKNASDLTLFVKGRRMAVNALQYISVWDNLFDHAARLLLKLGAAEVEHFSNNASSVFAGLFDLAYGLMAPTEASPAKRFALVRDIFKGGDETELGLVIEALEVALNTGSRSRSIDHTHQGIGPAPKLWHPRTYGEIYDAYHEAWTLLFDKLDVLSAGLRLKAIAVLARSAPGLALNTSPSDYIFSDLEKLTDSELTLAEKEVLLENVTKAVHYSEQGRDRGIPELWSALKQKLEGNTFNSLLWRYAGTEVTEFERDENGRMKPSENAAEILRDLAKQATANPELVKAELNWLVKAPQRGAIQFGYELGLQDVVGDQYEEILASTAQASTSTPNLLAGYLKAVRDRSEKQWENYLRELADIPKLAPALFSAVWNGGDLTDTAARLVLEAAKTGNLKLERLINFRFKLERWRTNPDNLWTWVWFLVSSGNVKLAGDALDIVESQYAQGDAQDSSSVELPEEVYALLTADVFTLEGNLWANSYGQDQHFASYSWIKLSQRFVKSYPNRELPLALWVVENLHSRGIFNTDTRDITDWLNKVTRQHPYEVWNAISSRLTKEKIIGGELWLWLCGNRLGFGLDSRKSAPALMLIPRELIWRWLEEDIDNRAWRLASTLPTELYSDDQPSLAFELLTRYGDRDDVRRNFSANFQSGGWTGLASTHYKAKLDSLKKLLETVVDANVRTWLNDEIKKAELAVERERVREEREF